MFLAMKDRKNITIDRNLWKRAKIFCIENDLDFSELVEKSLLNYIPSEKKPAALVVRPTRSHSTSKRGSAVVITGSKEAPEFHRY